MKSQKVQNKVFVIGVGMSKFMKPGGHSMTYVDMGKQAVERALFDSGIEYKDIEAGYVGYVFLPSCAGQKILYQTGLTGIPIVNVNNNCATGSTAFYLAYKAIQSGQIDCAIAVGVDKMSKGALPLDYDETSPAYESFKPLIEKGVFNTKIPVVPQVFGSAGKEHMDKYGTTFDQISEISVKNYKHGSNNPYAQFQTPVSCENVKNSNMIYYPLTKLNCCPTSDGAASCILVSEEYLKKNSNKEGILDRTVEIMASVLATDNHETFENKSMIDLIGYKLAKRAANEALSKAGITIDQVGAIELHDCFSANELLTYEALGLCKEGKGGEFIDKKDNTYGGKFVVNPSGGLTSKGHPLGATGIAQISELCWQLRGLSEKRQVPNLKYALSHNLGLGSALVVSIFKKYNNNKEVGKSSNPDFIDKQMSEFRLKSGKTKF